MQAIDTLFEIEENPHRNINTDLFKSDDFKPITEFLFKFFIKDSNLSFNGSAASLFDFLTGDEIFKKLKIWMKPTSGSLTESVVGSLLPTIKELQLYNKVISSFRCENVCFEGDSKFWEFFIREALQQFLAFHFLDSKPTRNQVAVVRNEYVEMMLAMDMPSLRKFLSDIHKNTALNKNEWVELSCSDLTESVVVTKHAPKFEIIENYKT